jgi:hypothetical protein
MSASSRGRGRRPFLRLLAAGAGLGPLVGPAVRGSLAADRGAAPSAPGRSGEPLGDTYEERRRALLQLCTASQTAPAPRFLPLRIFNQIARLELGQPIEERVFRDAIAYVHSNRDCNDFILGGLLRILYLYGKTQALPSDLREEIRISVQRFRFWWDEPGADTRCFWTENHQIIFHMDQLLAGQLYPDAVFQISARTGREHVAAALPRIRRWMGWRVRFGFSEWLSNAYFVEDLMPLVNLRDFAEQPDIRARAEMLIDLLLFEMAMHTRRGVMGCTHGRTYPRLIKGARNEDIATVCALELGTGVFNSVDNMAALSLATSGYRCPSVLAAIARDDERTSLCRERHSVNVEDAGRAGVSYDSDEDAPLFLSIQDYLNPLTLASQERVVRAGHIWQAQLYPQARDQYAKQVARWGSVRYPWLDCHAMGEVHIHTLRTPDYLLSCAQDYRPGSPGYQQHIWQATIDADAVVFTNHPGSTDERSRPNFWAGNGILPRAVQHGNVVVCIHHVPLDDPYHFIDVADGTRLHGDCVHVAGTAPLPYSHAYFPRTAFDEVVQRGHWTFGRKGDSYLALYSQNPTRWVRDAAGDDLELRADASDNVWICEMGARRDGRGFAKWVATIAAATVRCDGLHVTYDSPSQRRLSVGWTGPLVVAGRETPVHGYPRYDNPYCGTVSNAEQLTIRHGGASLALDFARNARLVG